MAEKRKPYTEPSDFFPKEIRKKAGLGEFNKDTKKTTKKTPAKKTTKK